MSQTTTTAAGFTAFKQPPVREVTTEKGTFTQFKEGPHGTMKVRATGTVFEQKVIEEAKAGTAYPFAAAARKYPALYEIYIKSGAERINA